MKVFTSITENYLIKTYHKSKKLISFIVHPNLPIVVLVHSFSKPQSTNPQQPKNSFPTADILFFFKDDINS